jgi:hypothetical protein
MVNIVQQYLNPGSNHVLLNGVSLDITDFDWFGERLGLGLRTLASSGNSIIESPLLHHSMGAVRLAFGCCWESM